MVNFNLPQLNDEQKAFLRRTLSEVDERLNRIDHEREDIKEAVKNLHISTDLPKKLINRMAKAYHKGTFTVEREENEDYHDVYENVVVKGVNDNGDE